MTTPNTLVRPAVARDADAVLRLQFALDHESDFMLVSRAEGSTDPGPLRQQLQAIQDGTDPSFLLVAANEELAGYLDVSVLPYQRARRTGYVVMGMRTKYQGRGIGKALLNAAADHGGRCELRRLELTVMEHNRAALALYLGCGFQVEGLRRAAIDYDGLAVNEYYMGRLLNSGAQMAR
jgi:ribosomal protein S18 acetylase RimI-like enzyme